MTENAKGLPFTSEFEKNWFRGLLKDGPVTISFLKKDGTERKMTCTLSESKIPEEKMPKNTGKAKSDESQPVFDLEKQEWRSFRWDSMKKFEFTLGEDEKTA
jgi:hypothetical protein